MEQKCKDTTERTNTITRVPINKKGEQKSLNPPEANCDDLGGSLSNLSCLSDFETSTCCKSSSKNKKSRSSVSSRSREGGSLPPTKFENMFEAAPASSHAFAWDTGGEVGYN